MTVRLLLALVAALTTSTAQALSIEEYARLEQNAQAGDARARSAADTYMAGIADALNSLRKGERSGPLLCAPEDVQFTRDQVRKRYREYLRTYPEVRKALRGQITVADVVLAAYADQYCGRTTGAPSGGEEATSAPLRPLAPDETR